MKRKRTQVRTHKQNKLEKDWRQKKSMKGKKQKKLRWVLDENGPFWGKTSIHIHDGIDIISMKDCIVKR
jgi:hypothetical protein